MDFVLGAQKKSWNPIDFIWFHGEFTGFMVNNHVVLTGKFSILILVGGFSHLEKYELVNGKDDNPYIMEKKKCLKPPTRIYIIYLVGGWPTPRK